MRIRAHCPRYLVLRCLAAALVGSLLSACVAASEQESPEPAALVVETPAPAAEPARPEPTPEPISTRWQELPIAADDPQALAEQLSAAERAIRDPSVSGAELAWTGHMQQLVYRRLVERPRWRDEVLRALPSDLRPAATANLNAAVDLRALIRPGETLPPWRIVEPAPSEELLGLYRAAETEFGVPWSYLAAIHLVETLMGRVRGTSVAGAQGPMQFIPTTWAAYGEGDVNDNRDAIRAAARYLRASGAPGNMANAVYRYNPSDRYVRAITAYAEVMRAAPETYRGYYHWQVYFVSTRGDVLLPVGYGPD
jgi:hypothetical protein